MPVYLRLSKEKTLNLKHLVILLLFIPLLSEGQLYREDARPEPGKAWQRVGVKAGIGISTISSDGFKNPIPQVGVQGGLYYRISLSKRFHFQPELSAAYKGAKFDGENDTGFNYTRLGLFYMDLPLYLVMSLDDKGKHNLMVAPTVSFLMRPNLYINKEYYPTFTTLPLKRFTYGVTAGYMFSLGSIGFQVAAKFDLVSIAGDFETFNTPGDGGSSGTLQLRELNPPLTKVDRLLNRSIELSLYF